MKQTCPQCRQQVDPCEAEPTKDFPGDQGTHATYEHCGLTWTQTFDDLAPDQYTRGWNAGYNQCLIDFLIKLGSKLTGDLDQLVDQLERMPKRETP